MRRSDLIRGLQGINPAKPYGTALFDALAKVTVSVAVEAVCLQLKRKEIVGVCCETSHGLVQTDDASYNIVEVYMTHRPPDDTAYPSEWHCPGSVLRSGEDIEDVFNRLVDKEFGGGTIQSARFVANVNNPNEARGHFLSLVYLCCLQAGRASEMKGMWFPVDQLPTKTIASHRRRIIPAALGAFVAENIQCA
ncbi:MAG: hypothetical protein NTY81_00535 [Candidatus Staskawiczbacteria bacterium]|nr:hypothetical protein [Candidatus Staskawiczbacteria bacterium]